MNFFKKLFGKKEPEPKSEDVLKLSKIIAPLLDESVSQVFNAFKGQLLNQPITYIVPAVWGATKTGSLTQTQTEIHQILAPVVTKTLDVLALENAAPSQIFAIGFIIRGMLIAKITYMLEAVRNNTEPPTMETEYKLAELEPEGTA